MMRPDTRNPISVILIPFLAVILANVSPCRAQFTIHVATPVQERIQKERQTEMQVQIVGYSGLEQQSLYQATLTPGSETTVETSYQGLAILIHEGGQQYPLILGKESFTLELHDPATLPTFAYSPANTLFYTLLQEGTGETGGNTEKSGDTESAQYAFAHLMIAAKQLLLASTGGIRTTDELRATKEKFHGFVRSNYHDLARSDMLRRLLGQYFMMHEYIDYHVPGDPATAIRDLYQQAVMDGVGNWLDILAPHMPRHEVLNYCVSLYYNRSMVSLAATIMEHFSDFAFCPGGASAGEQQSQAGQTGTGQPEGQQPTPVFPPELHLTSAAGKEMSLRDVTGENWLVFVSEDCPVSKVAAVINARRLAGRSDANLIVVPLQPLSQSHLVMQRMVSGGRMLFVDDEAWRSEYVVEGMALPRVIQQGAPATQGNL